MILIMAVMWKSILTDILQSGMTQTEVALAVGFSQATISDIYRGELDDPRASLGDALRDLYARRCTKEAA